MWTAPGVPGGHTGQREETALVKDGAMPDVCYNSFSRTKVIGLSRKLKRHSFLSTKGALFYFLKARN